MTTATFENKVRNTFTLEKEVDEELKQFIKPRARSEFINNLIKEGIKKERIKKLNETISNFKPIKVEGEESPIEVLRKFRQAGDERMQRLVNLHSK